MGKESKAARHPRGVSFDKSHRGKKKYKTRVFFNGKDRFIGRFETVEEASKAYQAAAAYFKGSPDQAESPEFLQFVRERVQGQDADQPSSGGRSSQQRTLSPAPTSWPQQTDLGYDQSSLPCPAVEQCNIYTLQQQCTSQDSISDASDPLMGVGCEGATVADAAQTVCAAAAMEVEQPSAAAMNACCSWPAANCSPDMGDSCHAVTEVMMEEAMAQEVYRVIGLLPEPQQQLPPFSEAHMASAGLLRVSNSCSNLPAAGSAFLQQQDHLQQQQHHHQQQQQQDPLHQQQQQQQRPQSATPSLGCSVGTAAMGLVNAASGSGSLTSALMQVQQQQQQQDEELQQLLHMALQGTGEVIECPSAPGILDQALEECCTEFLAATAAAGPATPAMSAPVCSFPPLAHQQQQQFVAIPTLSSVSGGAARAAAAAGDVGGYVPVAEAMVGELRSSGLMCQDSLLLLQADSCMDAVLYVASVVRAVLELYTTLLHRGEEDAAGDLLQWLSTFRQQQQQRQLSVLSAAAAAAAAPGIPPTTNLDALNTSVVQIMARIVQTLITASSGAASAAASAAAARAAVTASSSRSSLEVTSKVTGSNPPVGAPLARRSFVTAVLERLNNYLVGLHRALQQQHALAATPAALWQEVQRWLEQLRAQAVSAVDAVAVQLAALL